MNIFPLSCLSNLCRKKQSNRITWKMQFVLCFAGLRGAIAFALALNMPGPHSELYTTVTLTICSATTIICGGFTERILGIFGMKEIDQGMKRISGPNDSDEYDDDDDEEESEFFPSNSRKIRLAYDGLKGLWSDFDYLYLRPLFGGSPSVTSPTNQAKDRNDGLGHYELGTVSYEDDDIGGKDAM